MIIFNEKIFEEKVQETAERMLSCEFYNKGCYDVTMDINELIFPRCLIWESIDSSKTGAAVIGINPGILKDNSNEKKYYKEWDLNKGSFYNAFTTLWKETADDKKAPYYQRIKKLLRELLIEGSILWGELAHCQNKKPGKNPSPQTRGICSKNYLFPIIDELPENWPIIAIGKEVYNTLSFIYINRLVIGIPHPTGSRGHFSKLSKEDALLNEYKLNQIYQLDTIYNMKGSIWLPDLKAKS